MNKEYPIELKHKYSVIKLDASE